jgi:hypothetical protein
MNKRKDTSPLEGINKTKKFGEKEMDQQAPRAGETENRLQRALSQLSLASNASTQSRRATAYSFNGVNHGKLRTMIEVDVLTKDGEPFTRNMTEREAYEQIYKKSLRLPKSNLSAIQRSWRGHPFFCFRTKEPVNIDELPASFSYTLLETSNDGHEEEVKIHCQIRGVGDGQGGGKDGPQVRWVKIEGTSLNIKEEEITKWLSVYGELLTEIEEEEIRFSDEDESEGSEVQLGTGKFSVKMRITTDIPQYLPMFGHKAKIYYRGIKKTCTNCYKGGHYRKDCQEEKVDWINYVRTFINQNEEIPDEMFGRWFQICLKQPQESTKPPNPQTSKPPGATHPKTQPQPITKKTEDEPAAEKKEKKVHKRLPTKASSTKSKPTS